MEERIKVTLTLEDGTIYRGRSFGAPVAAAGYAARICRWKAWQSLLSVESRKAIRGA